MDIVNEYFYKFYPEDHDTNWTFSYSINGGGRSYNGITETIFPSIECNDGFRMSVQGHFGAYSFPNEDFADEYLSVEILCPQEELFGSGDECGNKFLYGHVPIMTVIAVIEKHGGMKMIGDNK